MVIVYNAQGVTDAYLIKGLLESEGIPARVFGADLQGGIGGLPVMGLVTVRVAEHLVVRARAVIEVYERAEPPRDQER